MIFNKLFVAFLIPVSLVLIGLLFVWVPASVVQAGPDLPVRSTPTPASNDDDDDDDDHDSGPLGATIELQAADPPDGAWAVVQWQNSVGGWEDVDGWQGPLPQNTRWWVAEKDFGDGPFRWVMKHGIEGPVLGTSEAFNLPGGANETVRAAVSLAQ